MSKDVTKYGVKAVGQVASTGTSMLPLPGAKWAGGGLSYGSNMAGDWAGTHQGNSFINYFVTTYGDSLREYSMAPGNNMQ